MTSILASRATRLLTTTSLVALLIACGDGKDDTSTIDTLPTGTNDDTADTGPSGGDDFDEEQWFLDREGDTADGFLSGFVGKINWDGSDAEGVEAFVYSFATVRDGLILSGPGICQIRQQARIWENAPTQGGQPNPLTATDFEACPDCAFSFTLWMDQGDVVDRGPIEGLGPWWTDGDYELGDAFGEAPAVDTDDTDAGDTDDSDTDAGDTDDSDTDAGDTDDSDTDAGDTDDSDTDDSDTDAADSDTDAADTDTDDSDTDDGGNNGGGDGDALNCDNLFGDGGRPEAADNDWFAYGYREPAGAGELGTLLYWVKDESQWYPFAAALQDQAGAINYDSLQVAQIFY